MRSGCGMGQVVKVLITASDSLLHWLTQLQFFWHTPWHPLPAETCSKSPEKYRDSYPSLQSSHPPKDEVIIFTQAKLAVIVTCDSHSVKKNKCHLIALGRGGLTISTMNSISFK